MSDQNTRNYVGNGKKPNPNYDLINVSLRYDRLAQHTYEYNGEKYVKLTVGALKEPNEWGKTHSVWINDYKPDNNNNNNGNTQNAPVSAGDGLPF